MPGFHFSQRRDLAMSAASVPQHDYFQESFSSQERQELLDEDTAAFSGVTGILMFVIAAGVALAVFTVGVILATS
jgi:hypothetical protein